MEYDCSSPWSQQPATGHYRKPDQSNLNFPTKLLINCRNLEKFFNRTLTAVGCYSDSYIKRTASSKFALADQI
jgi:hypothetical protein